MSEISVVMPVYNGEKYLCEAIDSVLNQSFSDFEFIIIDDGSTDSSKQIIQSYLDPRIHLYSIPNGGIANALNYGISLSKSNIIARMDCDDRSHPSRFQIQYDFLSKNKNILLLGTGARVIDENGVFVFEDKVHSDYSVIKSRLPESSFYHPSVMFRKSAFQKVGGYQVGLRWGEDVLLFSKLTKLGEVTNINQSLIDYRVTSTSLSVRDKRLKMWLKELIENADANDVIATENDQYNLENRIKKQSINEKRFSYHLFLAKKYLWNNPSRSNALYHIGQAYRIKRFDIELYFITILTIFPSVVVTRLYRFLKMK